MKKRTYVKFLVLLVLTSALFSCKKDVAPVEEKGKLKLQFTFAVDENPFQVDEMIYTNAAGNLYEVNEIQFFISDIILYKKDGDSVIIKDNNSIHYVDYAIPSTLTWNIADELPQGDYSSIAFTFGLSPEKNVSNTFVNPPESNMAWPLVLGGGYHYMMINGKWRTDETNSVFHFHTGIGQIYEDDEIVEFVHNHFKVRVPNSAFTIGENPTTLNLVMNINSWFTTPHDYDLDYFGGAIMQNQEAQEVIKANGWDVFTIKK